ncbi:MAG: hypothetical protein ABIS35_06880 [Terracoccus sp.]
MDRQRRRRLSRVGALTAVTAATLLGLTALASTTAVAAPRAASAPAHVVEVGLADVRLPGVPTAAWKAPTRLGSCSVAMGDR